MLSNSSSPATFKALPVALTLAVLAMQISYARDDFDPAPFISGFVALPVGSYGERNEGAATLGGGASLGFTVPLRRAREIAFVGEGYFIRNPMDLDGIEDELPGVEARGGGWSLVGALAGLRLSSSLPEDPGAGLYAQIQGGFNVTLMSDIVLSNGTTTVDESIAPGFSPALGLGLGLRDGRFGLGGRFLYLGKPELEMTAKNRDTQQSLSQGARQSISLITVAAELHF